MDDYNSEGLLQELHSTGQSVAYTAVHNTLLGGTCDGINRSGIPSNTLVGEEQNTPPQNERPWSAWLARPTDMSAGDSVMVRVQARRQKIAETPNTPHKIT